jgi:hypothetical protein
MHVRVDETWNDEATSKVSLDGARGQRRGVRLNARDASSRDYHGRPWARREVRAVDDGKSSESNERRFAGL